MYVSIDFLTKILINWLASWGFASRNPIRLDPPYKPALGWPCFAPENFLHALMDSFEIFKLDLNLFCNFQRFWVIAVVYSEIVTNVNPCREKYQFPQAFLGVIGGHHGRAYSWGCGGQRRNYNILIILKEILQFFIIIENSYERIWEDTFAASSGGLSSFRMWRIY